MYIFYNKRTYVHDHTMGNQVKHVQFRHDLIIAPTKIQILSFRGYVLYYIDEFQFLRARFNFLTEQGRLELSMMITSVNMFQ